MKLFYSTSSPYSRKARLTIQFKQLEVQVEQIVCNPFIENPEETHQNPLGKVPTLLLNDGTLIYDSPVICEYLDTLSAVYQLYPIDFSQRFQVKVIEALGDGILDAAYNIVMEKRRPDGESSRTEIKKWREEIDRSLQEAEKVISKLNSEITLAHISMYCMLGYLSFRLPEIAWQNSKTMSDWFAHFEQQNPSIENTTPY